MPTLLTTSDHTVFQAQGAQAYQRASAHHLALLAVQALIDEAELTPKPGLVDRRGSGAHRDLSLPLMLLSAHTLQPFFAAMAQAARQAVVDCELRERLGAIGRDAESAMLKTTGGINTHRGAIWTMGLLVASASQTGSLDPAEICATAGQIASMQDRYAPQTTTNGKAVRMQYGVQGARGEAMKGFPHVLALGLPALRKARRHGTFETMARLDALLAIMAELPDTCLLHRGGLAALEAAQTGARAARQLGGYTTAEGRQALLNLDAVLIEHWASPGGAADLLAATLFLDALTAHREGSLT